MLQIRSNNNITYRCYYHVVWCPKYRKPILKEGVDTRLKEIIQEVCQERSAEIEGLEILPDHVHLLVSIDPQYGIHRLVKQIKGRSSKILRQEFSQARTRVPTLWTNSYFVATAGGAPLQIIKQYVENQKTV